MEQIIISSFILIVALIAIWGNWIFLGPDGFALPASKIPNIAKFYLSLIVNPRGTLNSSAFWK